MKKIMPLVASIMVILVSGMFAGAGTMAWFSDPEQAAGNSFTADELNLELSGTHSALFTVADIAPGESGHGTLTLTSTAGSMDGELDVAFTNLVQAENGLIEPEIEAGDYENGGDLYLSLVIAAYIDVNKSGVFDAGDIQLAYNGQQKAYPGFWGGDFHYSSVSSMLSPWNNIMTMAGGQSVDLVIMWELPTTWTYPNYNQNIVMTDSLGFDIELTLEQPGVD